MSGLAEWNPVREGILKTIAFVCLLASLSAYVSGAGPFPFAEQAILPWSLWVVLLICINLSVWQKLMRVATFALLVIWFYAVLGNLIPQSTSGLAVAVGDIERTPDAFVSAGDAIFHGKGKCATCHTIGEGATKPRCPDLANIGIRAESRQPGTSAKDYLVESLYLPSTYLVEGYGSIMPEAWKPPIALTPLEIETVVAFLQSQGGEPEVSPISPPVDITAFEETPQRVLKGDLLAGKILFEEQLQCINCHKVGQRGGEGVAGGGIGPELSDIGALNTVDYIEESILEPNAKIVSGFGWTEFRLENGEQLSGTIIGEDQETLTLKLDEQAEEDDWLWEEEDETESDEAETDQEQVVAKKDVAVEAIEDTQDLGGSGYFWIQAVVNDSIDASGFIAGEDRAHITIKSGQASITIPKGEITRIAGRRIGISSKMPRYDEVITLKQFEDLVTYLASLKGTAAEEGK